jgi:hypothetical protein
VIAGHPCRVVLALHACICERSCAPRAARLLCVLFVATHSRLLQWDCEKHALKRICVVFVHRGRKRKGRTMDEKIERKTRCGAPRGPRARCVKWPGAGLPPVAGVR